MEPTLEGIEDYNQLKGEKKKIVWIVVIVGLLIGVGYTVASKIFQADDAITVKEAIVTVPFGKHEMPIR